MKSWQTHVASEAQGTAWTMKQGKEMPNILGEQQRLNLPGVKEWVTKDGKVD